MSETQLDRIERKVDRLSETIHGEGESPGLKGRVDRLEQAEERRVWAVRTAVVAAVSSVFAAGWTFITGGKG